MNALQDVRADNAKLREDLRSRGFADELLAFAAQEEDLFSALTSNERLAACVQRCETIGYKRGGSNPVSMTTPSNDRRALREDLHQQATAMRAKLAATIGCAKPVPAQTQDVEADIQTLGAFIEERRGEMGYHSFAAASALVGRVTAATDGGTSGKPNVTAAAQEAFAALGSLSPAQATLLSQWQAVEKNPRERSAFIRAHEKELLALAVVLDRQQVAQAESPNAARPGATGPDAVLIAEYQAVEKDPVKRSLFLRQHEKEIRAWLIANNH